VVTCPRPTGPCNVHVALKLLKYAVIKYRIFNGESKIAVGFVYNGREHVLSDIVSKLAVFCRAE